MVMIGNILVIALVVYYLMYFSQLFILGKHKELKESNVQLDKLRNKTIKTLEEQKAFISIKYPKSPKKKKTFKDWLFIFLFIVYIVIIAMIVSAIFQWLHIELGFWTGLLIVSVSPFLINLILSRWKLDQNDLLNILKWRRKK